jgi:hypothetical protein
VQVVVEHGVVTEAEAAAAGCTGYASASGGKGGAQRRVLPLAAQPRKALQQLESHVSRESRLEQGSRRVPDTRLLALGLPTRTFPAATVLAERQHALLRVVLLPAT